MKVRTQVIVGALIGVALALAGCSSSGSTGAVQDDAVASSSAAPSAVQGTSSAAADAGDSCAQGGPCQYGDTGPGGGVVFYVASSPFSAPGTACDSNCLYLETPLNDSAGGTTWCNPSVGSVNGATGTAIGSGYANTQAILQACGDTTTYAARDATLAEFGGLTDWYLPSTDEMSILYDAQGSGSPYLYVYGVTFSANPPTYWTSTQAGGKNGPNANCISFDTGQMANCNWASAPEMNLPAVHAIRAF